MRKASLLTVTVIAAMIAGSGAAQDTVIASDTPGALDVPERWDCNRIRPDYSAWLDKGNPAANWKYVGKTYRDTQTGETYNWQNWLDWAEEARCAAVPPETANPNTNLLIGGAITVFGAGLIAIHAGSGPKSPG